MLSTAAGRQVRRPGVGPTDLPAGESYITLSTPAAGASRYSASDDRSACDGGIAAEAYVGFSGPARVRRVEGSLSVSFPDRGPITVGFERNRSALETVTVPRTPTGVATAITHLSAALRTEGADRSHPAFRSHPPLVEFGDEVEVPASIRATTPDTGIRLAVPATIADSFVAAPLAYYLGATVVAEERSAPVLSAPSIGLERHFRPSQRSSTTSRRRCGGSSCSIVSLEPLIRKQ